jgi:hypothetical protein
MLMVSSQAGSLADCASGRLLTAEIRFDPRLGKAGFVVDRVAMG